jgi:hypothetical protein
VFPVRVQVPARPGEDGGGRHRALTSAAFRQRSPGPSG